MIFLRARSLLHSNISLKNNYSMASIKAIKAREILDSRGNPTVAVTVYLSNGVMGEAKVPSGASTGSHEALELRDGDRRRFGGMGVLKAVRNVNTRIAKKLIGMESSDLLGIDLAMIRLDGTENKTKLGANAILGVSLACANAGAHDAKMPLYRFLRKVYDLPFTDFRLPYPTMNILNGGKHADSGLNIQEFMVIPWHKKYSERVRIGAEIYQALKTLLRKKGFPALIGDEGGFAPHLGRNEAALKTIVEAICSAGYTPGKDAFLGIDLAASEFYDEKRERYMLEHGDKKGLTGAQMIAVLQRWVKKYPIKSIEDALSEDDWSNWQIMTKKLGGAVTLVGDDLFVTNVKRLAIGIDKHVANAILIKLNQIGTMTETIRCIRMAQEAGYKICVSHRSGETADTTIADLAVAVNADYLKSGAPARAERVEKYNRVWQIEQELQLQ